MSERVVYVSGAWDLFHVGHLNVIREASLLGDKLVVGVSTDAHIESYKGRLPIIPFEERCKIVSALRYVDVVEVADEVALWPMTKHSATIRAVEFGWCENPRHEHVVRLMLARGYVVVYIPRTLGVSTTLIKQKVKKEK